MYTLHPVCRNNECPACRTHCASRRSLRDDPNYDALILALYPDIDKYEEEVMYKLSRNRLCFLWLFCCSASNLFDTTGTCFQ